MFERLHSTAPSTLFTPPAFLAMPAVGLDITDSSVRYLELAETPTGRKLGSWGERALPAGAVSGGEIKDMQALVGVLRTLRRDIKTPLVRVALPEEKAYLFQMALPRDLSRVEARTAIESRLEEQVPVPVSEAVFDFEEIRHAPSAGSTERPVSVSVYARSIVDAYYEALSAAGFSPLSFEVELQAIARSVLGPDDDPCSVMLVDFGRKRTALAIVSHRVLQFSATVEIGSDALADAVAKGGQRADDESAAASDQEAMIGALAALRDEVNRHMSYWNGHVDQSGHEIEPVSELVLCGDGENMNALANHLMHGLNIPTRIPNVWQHAFSFNDVIPEIPFEDSVHFAAAIGLALRSGL